MHFAFKYAVYFDFRFSRYISGLGLREMLEQLTSYQTYQQHKIKD